MIPLFGVFSSFKQPPHLILVILKKEIVVFDVMFPFVFRDN